MDFFGTGPTSNPNQTTSYNPRLRQAWGRAKFANGWTITGGQMWNLITLNRRGTDADNSNLWIPNIIEAQYSVGYDWGRFAEFRVSKTLDKNFTLALGIANPSYLNSGANAAVSGLAANGNGLLANSLVSTCTSTVPVTCTNTPTYSTNLAPDMVVKLAYDSPKLGHYEIKGLGRFFRDRVVPTATTAGYDNTGLGGGVGAGAVIPVITTRIEFHCAGNVRQGHQPLSRCGPVRLRGSRYRSQSAGPVKSFSALAGFETHPTSKTEFDTFFGGEYYYRTTYLDGTTVAGYGAPGATNTGCFYETWAAQAINPAATVSQPALAITVTCGMPNLSATTISTEDRAALCAMARRSTTTNAIRGLVTVDYRLVRLEYRPAAMRRSSSPPCVTSSRKLFTEFLKHASVDQMVHAGFLRTLAKVCCLL